MYAQTLTQLKRMDDARDVLAEVVEQTPNLAVVFAMYPDLASFLDLFPDPVEAELAKQGLVSFDYDRQEEQPR